MNQRPAYKISYAFQVYET